MPHATNEFPFEWRVMGGVRSRLALLLELSDEAASMLVVFRDQGRFEVHVGLAPEELRQQTDAVEAQGIPYIMVDPLDDGREYQWLCWGALSRSAMERWIGEPFTAADFVSWKTGDSRDFPKGWGVMF